MQRIIYEYVKELVNTNGEITSDDMMRVHKKVHVPGTTTLAREHATLACEHAYFSIAPWTETKEWGLFDRRRTIYFKVKNEYWNEETIIDHTRKTFSRMLRALKDIAAFIVHNTKRTLEDTVKVTFYTFELDEPEIEMGPLEVTVTFRYMPAVRVYRV